MHASPVPSHNSINSPRKSREKLIINTRDNRKRARPPRPQKRQQNKTLVYRKKTYKRPAPPPFPPSPVECISFAAGLVPLRQETVLPSEINHDVTAQKSTNVLSFLLRLAFPPSLVSCCYCLKCTHIKCYCFCVAPFLRTPRVNWLATELRPRLHVNPSRIVQLFFFRGKYLQ